MTERIKNVIRKSNKDLPADSVTVYKGCAEVYKRIPVNLCIGENELIIDGPEKCTRLDAIEGKVVITDISFSLGNICKSVTQEVLYFQSEIDRLMEERRQWDRKSRALETHIHTISESRSYLDSFADRVSAAIKNSALFGKGDGSGFSTHLFESVAVLDFFKQYEERLALMDKRYLKLIQEDEFAKQEAQDLSEKIRNKNPPRGRQMVTYYSDSHLKVSLDAEEEGEAILLLSYIVSDASWSTSYDIRAFTEDKTMKIQYYGVIKQQTGEDWENAKISLSTSKPSVEGTAPYLPRRIVRFKKLPAPTLPNSKPQNELRKVLRTTHTHRCPQEVKPITHNSVAPSIDCTSEPKVEEYELSEPIKELSVIVSNVKTGLFITTFSIPRPATIPSGTSEIKVTIALIDLSPEFTYSSVPRLSPYSFLQAKAKNTSTYPLMAGPANILVNNNFVAMSKLSDKNPNEEIMTSLGADQSIRITCHPISTVHNTRKALLGGAKTYSVVNTHLFVVKNTNKYPVWIKISEQVPLSTDDRIKVTVTEPDLKKVGVVCPLPFGHAVLNESNNIDWHAEVGAGKELDLKLVYTVDHPAQDGVEGLPGVVV